MKPLKDFSEIPVSNYDDLKCKSHQQIHWKLLKMQTNNKKQYYLLEIETK